MQNNLSIPSNPYFHQSPMLGPDMFYGRISLRRRFYSALANRQSVSLFGSRHIGKSSLLWSAKLSEMQQPYEVDLSHHIFVCLDLREHLR